MKTMLIIYSIIIVVFLVGLLGWGMNIYKFAKSDFQDPYTPEFVRGAGIAAPPFGAILGFIELEDEKTPQKVSKTTQNTTSTKK